MTKLARLYSPLPPHFDRVRDELLKEVSLRIKGVAPTEAIRMIEKRKRALEKEYYVRKVLRKAVSDPRIKLAIISGENPLEQQFKKNKEKEEADKGDSAARKRITAIKDTLESANIGATLGHFTNPAAAIALTLTTPLTVPIAKMVGQTVLGLQERKKYPLSALAKTFIKHRKITGAELDHKRKVENFTHLRRRIVEINEEHSQLETRLKMLEALQELLRQPRQTPETALENWVKAGLVKLTCGRMFHLIGEAAGKGRKPTSKPGVEEIYRTLVSETKYLRDLLPDDLNAPGEWEKIQQRFPELRQASAKQDWINLQKRLDLDEAEYCKALEIELDLNEMNAIKDELQKPQENQKELEERLRILEEKYPDQKKARKLLGAFLKKSTGNVFKIQAKPQSSG